MTTDEYNQFLQQQNALIQPIGSSPYSSTPDNVSGNDNSMATMLQGQQNFNNTLQLYQQAQKAQAINSQFGPPPAGISQNDWVNMCERLAESMTGNHQVNKFPTAAAAENYYAQSGQLNPNVNQAPPGSIQYFAPDQSNGNMGHAAVVNKNGSLTMSDNAGIQTFPSLQAWVDYSKQRPIGFVIPK